MNKTDPIETVESSSGAAQNATELNQQKTETRNLEGWSKNALDRAAEQAQEALRSDVQNLAHSVNGRAMDDAPFVGQSSLVNSIFDLIGKVADTDSTVLILGESGTGKELVARALHRYSSRRSKPFVPVNCGAIPSELLETELFGHVKGAYTGAHSARVGRFTLADKGTLFLDEIGTMPASLQVKILRALQAKEFEPVGGNKTQKSDCRVIAATNIDLELEVQKGNFREDLFYRLNVIPITLPPLRERKEDIPLLIQHFIQAFNAKKGYQIGGIGDEALDYMMRYRWPGNVRELENIIQRMCILKGQGVIDVIDLPIKLKTAAPAAAGSKTVWSQWITDKIPDEGIPFDDLVAELENDLILKALDQTRWNKNKAAQLLRLNRTTLVEKIKKRGLVPPQNAN